MAIPDFQSVMLPLMKLAGDGKERSSAQIRESLSDVFGLSEEERAELLPSGRQPVFNNRVAWACVYLQKAGLLQRPKRGHYQITEQGLEVLKDPPARIDIKYLQRFPDFSEFREAAAQKKVTEKDAREFETPEEALDGAYQQVRAELAQELLTQVKACSPPVL